MAVRRNRHLRASDITALGDGALQTEAGLSIGLAVERFTRTCGRIGLPAHQAADRERAGRRRSSAVHRQPRAGEPRGWRAAETTGNPIQVFQSQWPTGDRANPPKYPVCQLWRPQVPRCRAYQRLAGLPEVRRESARRASWLQANATDARRQADLRTACIGCHCGGSRPYWRARQRPRASPCRER